MIFKDIVLATLQENILYDEVLFYLAEKEEAGESLRFWESSQLGIVLGRTGKTQEDINIENVVKNNISVFRRTSGGGTVLQGPGCLNFSLILSKDRDPQLNDLRKSYQIILNKIVSTLQKFDIKGMFRPISDLAVEPGEKKFSGNAQHRGRKYILHHGTILYQFSLPMIEKYLKIPKDMPPYRQNRGHLDFVTNVFLEPGLFKEAVSKEFAVENRETSLSQRERQVLKELGQQERVRVSKEELIAPKK